MRRDLKQCANCEYSLQHEVYDEYQLRFCFLDDAKLIVRFKQNNDGTYIDEEGFSKVPLPLKCPALNKK